MDLLSVAIPEGSFDKVEDLKGSPVPNEEVVENIKRSGNLDLPVFIKSSPKEGSFIFIAGGSTLLDFVEEIRERKEKGEFICTSNKTHDFLVDNGIIPDACVIIDPKECVKSYIQKPQKETTYYVGVVCNPAVFENLLLAGVKVEKFLVAYGLEDESDIKLQRTLYPDIDGYNYLVGGTMMGLRAMPLACLFGYKKIEYYGFDSCFSSNYGFVTSDDPRYEEIKEKNHGRYYSDADLGVDYVLDEPCEGGFFYAYKKVRSENIQVAKVGGRQFLTSPCFAHQAKQFIKWVDRMEGKLEVIVHGDSLSSYLLSCHRASQEKAKATIGDNRWTQPYAEIQKEMHAVAEYGMWGDHEFELVGRAIVFLYSQLKRPIRILDYGCGKAKLAEILNKTFNIVEVTNYDPFISEYSKEPEGQFDIVTCFDVMEHVEIQCVDNVLRYIKDKTKIASIFAIATEDAIKFLPDGRNAHITQKSPLWWANKLNDYFTVTEGVYVGGTCYLSCQAFDAKERLNKEKVV